MAGAQSIQKVGHIHEFIINAMLENPMVTRDELCQTFGYSPGWMSRLTNSDSFQARLAERREQLLDPQIKARLNDKLKSVTLQALDTIQHKLNSSPESAAELALASLGVVQQSLGILNPPKK